MNALFQPSGFAERGVSAFSGCWMPCLFYSYIKYIFLEHHGTSSAYFPNGSQGHKDCFTLSTVDHVEKCLSSKARPRTLPAWPWRLYLTAIKLKHASRERLGQEGSTRLQLSWNMPQVKGLARKALRDSYQLSVTLKHAPRQRLGYDGSARLSTVDHVETCPTSKAVKTLCCWSLLSLRT